MKISYRRSLLLAVGVIAAGVLFILSGSGQPCCAADNAIAQVISPAEYRQQYETAPHLLLDVRTPEEFADGHIPGAVNISLQTLGQNLASIPTDRPVVIYCRSGNRSAQAMRLLAEAGYTSLYDLGGIITWQAQGYPVQ